MDKNTIIGMLLMCTVIFGFMYFQSNDEKAKQATKAKPKTEQAASTQNNVNIDTLSREELNELDSLVAINGKISDGGINLTNSEGKLAGTVTVNNTTLNIDSINIAGKDNTNQSLAVANVREMMTKYKNAKMFSESLKGTEQTYKLKNDSILIEVSTKGAMITKATLTGYKAYHSQEDYKNNTSNPVELINGNNTYSFIFHNNRNDFDTKDFYFEAENPSDSSVTMSLNHLPSGAKWSIRYTLPKNSYMVKMELLQSNMDKIMDKNITDMDLVWKQKMLFKPKT